MAAALYRNGGGGADLRPSGSAQGELPAPLPLAPGAGAGAGKGEESLLALVGGDAFSSAGMTPVGAELGGIDEARVEALELGFEDGGEATAVVAAEGGIGTATGPADLRRGPSMKARIARVDVLPAHGGGMTVGPWGDDLGANGGGGVQASLGAGASAGDATVHSC